MKTKRLLILLLCLVGCREITYREPQPKGVKPLSSVPDKLIGKYPLPEDDGSVLDTLIIHSNGYYFEKDDDKGVLGEKLVLKYYKGYYFVSMKDDTVWFLRVIQQDKNGNITIMSMENEGEKFPMLISDLSKEIKVDSTIIGEDTYYQIDPSPKQQMSLIKKGYYKKFLVLKKLKE